MTRPMDFGETLDVLGHLTALGYEVAISRPGTDHYRVEARRSGDEPLVARFITVTPALRRVHLAALRRERSK